jgi:parallel beta-helix repeat protein
MRQRRFLLPAVVLTLAASATMAHATDIWVDSNYTGSVSDGSSAQPFKKISDTWSAVQPGDTVRVRPGTYREGVWIKSGSAAARVTYKSEVKWGAKILTPATDVNGGCFQYWGGNIVDNVSDPSAWTTPGVSPCGWVTIDGFDLHSEKNDNTGAGTSLRWVHHVTVRNCWAHDNATGGIGAGLADYMIFENNIVNNNAIGTNTGGVWGSGIGIWKVRPWDTAAGFHNKIRNNVVFNNHNDLNTPHTDGNGIIIDTTAFDKGTLVENNLVVNNGGGGILLDGSANCTVRYNTLYQNSWDMIYPEIYAQKVVWELPAGTGNLENAVCKNIQIYGNIVVAKTNRLAVKTNSDNISSTAHHNLRWFSGQSSPTNVPAFYGNDGNISDTTGTGDITGQDPQFVSAGSDPYTSDFHLQHYSPAINKYTTNTSDSKDLDGQSRSGSGSFVDYGAYEYKSFVNTPGFEGLASFGAPYFSWSNGGSFVIDTSNGKQHVGSKSLTISVASGAAGRWNSLLQTISGLSPSATYTITAWVRNPVGAIGSSVYLGTSLTGGGDRGSTPILPTTGVYSKYLHTFTTGSLSSLDLYLGYSSPGSQNSELRIDDISVNLKTILP